jgi:hypothetical protein
MLSKQLNARHDFAHGVGGLRAGHLVILEHDTTHSLRSKLGRRCMMTRYGIARFVGSRVSASGYRLRIKKVLKDRASVDFPDRCGVPIQRPYMRGAPSVKMIAR